MFSYARELKRFRPFLRIQTFVDSPPYTPAHKKKRSQLIRDWFQLVLWYVRLRRASKGGTPYKLLELEEAMQSKQLQNAVAKVKRASIEGYEPYYGSDNDEVEEAKKGGATPTPETDKPSETEIDAMEAYEKQEAQSKKNQVLRAILGGFNFTLKLEGIKVRLHGSN